MTMIYLSFYGNLIRFKKDRSEKVREMEIEPGSTLADTAAALGMNQKEAQLLLCNGVKVGWDYVPSDGDGISFYSLMSGG